jgi:hypothetical protein
VHVFEKPCSLAGLNKLLISVLSCANSFAISAAEKQVEMRSCGGGIPIYRDYRVINHQEIEQNQLASLSFLLFFVKENQQKFFKRPALIVKNNEA